MAKTTRSSLEFSIAADAGGDVLKNARAYAFTPHGRFITSAPIEGGKTLLDLGETDPSRVRILIAPVQEKTDKTPTIESLERINAYEPSWQFDASKRIYELLPIPSLVTNLWPLCKCRVRGK